MASPQAGTRGGTCRQARPFRNAFGPACRARTATPSSLLTATSAPSRRSGWTTAGHQVPVARPPRRRATGSSLQRAEPAAVVERPLWQIVAMLYAALLVIVAFVIALSFTVAHLV